MQKHVNLVDLVKSFPTNIDLQNLASIQPRASPVYRRRRRERASQSSVNYPALGFNFHRAAPPLRGTALRFVSVLFLLLYFNFFVFLRFLCVSSRCLSCSLTQVDSSLDFRTSVSASTGAVRQDFRSSRHPISFATDQFA